MTPQGPELPQHIRIAFIISGLTIGGAELMLWKLLSRIERTAFAPLLIVLSPRVDLGLSQRIGSIDVPCMVLQVSSLRRAPAALWALRTTLSRFNPHIVQGWMYYGDLTATLAGMLRMHKGAVLWNVRGTLLAKQRRLTSFVSWLCGRLSSSPSRIIYNSRVSAREHEQQLGYPAAARAILPNGFDTDLFTPSAEARESLCSTLGLPPGSILVGLFGRYHPMKDHRTFLEAGALLKKQWPNVHFIFAGQGVDRSNSELGALVESLGVSDRVHLLGVRDDLERLTPALDVAVSSSRYGEGFPNVLGEAMSCGVPCVATDVGDSSWVVDDTGRIVPPADPKALANAITDILRQDPAERAGAGARARERILQHFALDAVVRQYEDLYRSVHARYSEYEGQR